MREAEHVEGFAPQVAWVTQGGTEKLEERLVVRPTSETIIGTMRQVGALVARFAIINQWANVVRWEKVTRLFLRTTEFLWQEGAHRARDGRRSAGGDASDARRLQGFRGERLGIPALDGQKTESEKFAAPNGPIRSKR